MCCLPSYPKGVDVVGSCGARSDEGYGAGYARVDEVVGPHLPTSAPQASVLSSSFSSGLHAEAAVRSCLWFTYRSGFDPIPATQFTSDAGWGCMMRSGQMIVGAALLRLKRAELAAAERGTAEGTRAAAEAYAKEIRALGVLAEEAEEPAEGTDVPTAQVPAAQKQGMQAPASQAQAVQAQAAQASSKEAPAVQALAEEALAKEALADEALAEKAPAEDPEAPTMRSIIDEVEALPFDLGTEHEAAIVRLFADSLDAQFSLMRITLEGAKQGIAIGNWMGPASIAQVLAQLSARGGAVTPRADVPGVYGNDSDASAKGSSYAASLAEHRAGAAGVPGLRVCVAMDGTIYRDEVVTAAAAEDGVWRPLLLLVPLRLGLDRFNYAYAPALLAAMQLPQCLGIIGGRPRSSYYFVGVQGDRLLFLDPHEVQPALSADCPQLATCHYARNVRTMRLADIDPSLTLGFLLASAADFEAFCEQSAQLVGDPLAVFSVAGARPAYEARDGAEEREGLDSDPDEDLVVV
mmetsp:Transcript_19965/g.54773  ORF Transcript_19965/g.54773 Transcript_19965/m.54773 type:complete len:521 (-) Transcript_19965:577-2139(-)